MNSRRQGKRREAAAGIGRGQTSPYFVTCQGAWGFLGCRFISSSFPPWTAGKAGTEPGMANSRRLRAVPNPRAASLEAPGSLARNKIWGGLPPANPGGCLPALSLPPASGNPKCNKLSELLRKMICPRAYVKAPRLYLPRLKALKYPYQPRPGL